MSKLGNANKQNMELDELKRFIRGLIKVLILIISTVMFFALMMIRGAISDATVDQQAALRWTGEKNNGAQVSLFIKSDSKIENNDVLGLKYQISSSLKQYLDTEKYIFDENDPFSGPFTVATSKLCKLSISVDDLGRSSNEVSCYGISGDFFTFHPINLINGRYFDDSDADDSIILDSHSAFNLFGSADCLGMPVYIGKKPYYVRGVYEPDADRLHRKAGADMGYIFIPFNGLKDVNPEISISSIEVVSVEPYKGFLYGFLKDSTKTNFEKDSYVTVLNTDRFRFDALISNVISEWGARSMGIDGISYPYWENVARGTEDILALLMIFQFIFLVIMVVIVMSYVLFVINHSGDELKFFENKVGNVIDKSHKKHYEVKKLD